MKKPVWVYGGPRQEFLVAEDGRILAKILRLGFMGPWLYKDAEYIDLESAKCVAEKDLGDILRGALSSPEPAPLTQRMPEYLLGGMRFKVCVPNYRDGAEIIGIPEELNGRWVAFVAAENDCHLRSAVTRVSMTTWQMGQVVVPKPSAH